MTVQITDKHVSSFAVADCHQPIINRAIYGTSILCVQLQIFWNHCCFSAEIFRGSALCLMLNQKLGAQLLFQDNC